MNIAEMLKYCPKGTKLYSTIFGEVKLDEVCHNSMIKVIIKNNNSRGFYKDGSFSEYGECVLFPSKDQRDWDEFRLPVKRGDIMMEVDGTIPFIASGEYYGTSPKYICGVNLAGHFSIGAYGWTSKFYIPASEEAKKELFDKMAEAGYRWNADTLELEKIEPKYRPFANTEECWQEMQKHNPFGWIKYKTDNVYSFIVKVDEDYAYLAVNKYWSFDTLFKKKYTFADGTPFGIKE